MKRIILFIATIVSFTTISIAQVENDKTEKKNELMIESASANHFNFLVSSINPSILYRRNIKSISLRVRTSLVNNNEFSASVGIQKNIPIASNIQFYWGGDVFGTKVNARQRNEYFNENLVIVRSGISPIVGLKFNLSKRIFIGVENSSALYYEEYNRDINYINPLDQDIKIAQPSFQFDMFQKTRFNLGFNF